jgi:hypothetical protein
VSYTSVHFVLGTIDGYPVDKVILAGSVTFKAINPMIVDKWKLHKLKLVKLMGVSLANEGRDEITEFVIVDIVVGRILCIVPAFVFGLGDVDMLMLQNWFMRI